MDRKVKVIFRNVAKEFYIIDHIGCNTKTLEKKKQVKQRSDN